MKNEERLFLLKSYLALPESPLLAENKIESEWDDRNYLDINKFRKLIWQSGLPENEKYRPDVWKILLGYLPLNSRSKWQIIQSEQHQLYESYIEEFVSSFDELALNQLGNDSDMNKAVKEEVKSDHPLCNNSRSDWNIYFKDKSTLQTIQLDVDRTLTDFHFLRIDDEQDIKNEHNLAMQRILFLFVKLNSGIGYVQGMNDLVATLYYVNLQSQKSEPSWTLEIEADTFHMFNLLIQGSLRDLYNKTLDWDHSLGVGSILKNFTNRMESADPVLSKDLKDKSIEPSYYVFRYVSTLGTREFSLPDLVEIWDFLLSYGTCEQAELVDTMVMISVAMVVLQKKQLVESDFNENVKLLQAYPYPHPPYEIVELAVYLDYKFNGYTSRSQSPNLDEGNSEFELIQDQDGLPDSSANHLNLGKKVNHFVGKAGSQLRHLASNLKTNPKLLDKVETKLNWSNKSIKDWISNRHNARNVAEKEMVPVPKP